DPRRSRAAERNSRSDRRFRRGHATLPQAAFPLLRRAQEAAAGTAETGHPEPLRRLLTAPPRMKTPGSLRGLFISHQRAVAVLEPLARAAGAGIVARGVAPGRRVGRVEAGDAGRGGAAFGLGMAGLLRLLLG